MGSLKDNPQPLVSAIVTTHNNEDIILRCLDSIRAQEYSNLEIIVVDNHSTDNTVSLARNSGYVVHTCGPERSAQRNCGARKARGDYFVFIDSDMQLERTVISDCVMVAREKRVGVIFIPEKTTAEGFWGKCKVFERDFYLAGDMTVAAARFFSRSVFEAIGGYDENQTGTEDWDLSDRAIARFPYVWVESAIVHHEGRINLCDQLRKKRRYLDIGIRNYMSHAPAYRRWPYPFKPSVIRQWYRFILNPIYGIGSIIMKTLEMLVMIR
jgi:arabinofuranan 3-O-arabinosyltransferase